MTKTYYIKTYGCQMNAYDSDRMRDMIEEIGFTKESIYYNDVDLVILNTCHIREKAAEKLYSDLGRISAYKDKLRKKGKNMIVAVCGCTAEADKGDVFRRNADVDIVLGPQSYHKLKDAIQKAKEVFENPDPNNKKLKFHEIIKKDKYIDIECNTEEKFKSFAEYKRFNPVSAFVTIQEGCNKFCTFCIVPYTRGKEYCRDIEDVMHEVQMLASRGVKEIVFLGQNVDAYKDKDGHRLSHLIEKTSKIEEIKRIKYTTSHPINITEDLIECHRNCEKLMPILSLPVQSGSDEILKKMNRKYDRNFYIDIVKKLRNARPDLIMSSDFIVGFPGETEQNFEDTINLVKEIGFYGQSFSFKYSPRSGTTASIMKDHVDNEIASQRLERLQILLEKQRYDFQSKMLNKEMDVLFDNKDNRGSNQISGRNIYGHICLVETKTPEDKDKIYGQIHKVKITDIHPNSLSGVLIDN